MDVCFYHPLTPATWACPQCEGGCCDHCIDEGSLRSGPRCLYCETEVHSLGAGNGGEPFWRKLPDAFRYPTTMAPLLLNLACAVLGAIALVIPFGFVLQIVLTGLIYRYAFSCLQLTAGGKLTAPEISGHSEGGVSLLLKLFALLLLLGAIIGVAGALLGNGVAGLLATAAVLLFPAMIILFSIEESLLTALNPLRLIQLTAALGGSYVILLGMLMVMVGSVGMLYSLFDQRFAGIAWVVQTAIANFYLIVFFHLLGRMVFQNQGRLGFSARSDEQRVPRTDQALLDARLDVALKRGEYRQLFDLFVQAQQQYPALHSYHQRCFNFLLNARMAQWLTHYFPHYVLALRSSGRSAQIHSAYKQVLKIKADYKPDNAELCHTLARECRDKGDNMAAVKLLTGLHKTWPQYSGLRAAYELLADTLADLPELQTQAEKCRQLAASFPASVSVAPVPSRRVTPVSNPAAARHTATTENFTDSGRPELPPIEFKL